MDFSLSPVANLVNEVIEGSTETLRYLWKVEFFLKEDSPVDLTDADLAVTEQERNGFFSPIFVSNLDFIGDYEKGFCDHINMTCDVPLGMWVKVLEPSKHHMTLYLTRTRVKSDGTPATDDTPVVMIFKPVFKADNTETIGSTRGISRRELDIRDLYNLDIDLMPYAVEAVQAAVCGGTWRNVKAIDVMRGVFIDVCKDFEYEGDKLIKHQRCAGGANDKVLGHITIKPGEYLTDLPSMLQKHHLGIWPTGINRYLQGDTWFFYPPYDVKRVEKETKVLTVIVAPEKPYGGSERSYLVDGDNLKIICTGTIGVVDPTQNNFLRDGDGIRYASASQVLDGDWLETKGGKAVATRSKNFNELRVKADKYTDHRTARAGAAFSDNTLQNLSVLAGRVGKIVTLSWSYADHTLIEPGMPCRVFYDDHGEVKELIGQVSGMHASIQTTQRAAAVGNHVTTCALFIFCQAVEDV